MENFATEKLLQLFTQYAKKEGSSTLLSTIGLENLIKDNFTNFLGSMSFNDIKKHADIDKDGKINFNDFKALITKLGSMGGLSALTGLAGFGS